MAPPNVQFPSYLNFIIIILMAAVVTFRLSVCLPTDTQDQVLATDSSLGIWGFNKEGQSKTSNLTVQKTCVSTGTCTTQADCSGSNCECKTIIGLKGTILLVCGEADPVCTIGATCIASIINDCGTGCTCGLIESTFKCQSVI